MFSLTAQFAENTGTCK